MTDRPESQHDGPSQPIFGTLVWRADDDGCTHLVAQDGVPHGLRVAWVSDEGAVIDITDEVMQMASPALGGVYPAWYVPGPCTVVLTLGDRVVTVETGTPW